MNTLTQTQPITLNPPPRPEPQSRPSTQPILREHWLVDAARKCPVGPQASIDPSTRLNIMYHGALRDCVRSRATVTVYRDLIAAYDLAEEIVTERAAEQAHYAPLVKPEPAPEPKPAPPAPSVPAAHKDVRYENGKTILTMPGRPRAPLATTQAATA